MAVPPKRRNPDTLTPTQSTYVVEQGVRPRVTIEIETMTKGEPKVIVRIDGDDPDETQTVAVRLYLTTVLMLKQEPEIEHQARDRAGRFTVEPPPPGPQRKD